MLTSILAPVDFSSDSARGLLLAAEIARRHSARLTVLHVDGLPGYSDQLSQFAANPAWGDYLTEHDRALQTRLREFVRPLEFQGDLAFAVVRGDAGSAIVAHAAKHPCDLIVIAPRGSGYGQQFLLGSVSAHVAAAAACPVLVARSRAGAATLAGGFAEPLVAVSNGEMAARSLEVTLALSRAGTRVELVHVLEACEIAAGPPLPGAFHEAVAKSRRDAELRLERLAAPARAAGFSTAVRVETGDPSFSILCRAEDDANGLVVVSRKTSASGPSSLSTPAYRMVKHAPVPVLVVPSPAARHSQDPMPVQ
ncbi:MAG TPA: universal stress protein [Polyangiaceae bacterium]|nr:universal stress protein [Polyangiaceae bacterium]